MKKPNDHAEPTNVERYQKNKQKPNRNPTLTYDGTELYDVNSDLRPKSVFVTTLW